MSAALIVVRRDVKCIHRSDRSHFDLTNVWEWTYGSSKKMTDTCLCEALIHAVTILKQATIESSRLVEMVALVKEKSCSVCTSLGG